MVDGGEIGFAAFFRRSTDANENGLATLFLQALGFPRHLLEAWNVSLLVPLSDPSSR
jgi:hypothetical protein